MNHGKRGLIESIQSSSHNGETKKKKKEKDQHNGIVPGGVDRSSSNRMTLDLQAFWSRLAPEEGKKENMRVRESGSFSSRFLGVLVKLSTKDGENGRLFR